MSHQFEEIKREEFDPCCPICLTVMVEPVKTPCEHIFCKNCLTDFIKLNCECALCRKIIPKDFKMDVEEELDAEIKYKFPEEYAKSKKLIETINAKKSYLVDVEFEVGNFHKDVVKVGKNSHKLTPFVRIKDPKNRKALSKLVASAKFILHESFKRRLYETEATPGMEIISATWNGWGAFEMPIQISWTPESGIEGITTFETELQFRNNWKTCKVKIDSRVIDKYFVK